MVGGERWTSKPKNWARGKSTCKPKTMAFKHKRDKALNIPYLNILISRGGLGGKSGPGVTVRPAHSIHAARPTQYTASCPLNTRRVAHSMHRTYRPVSGLLRQIPDL